jgi:NADH:ubiquinone oxidoreductase subunit C
MKDLADFKRLIKPGQTWHGIHHPMKKDLGVREVSKVNTKGFAFRHTKDDGEVTDSWCYFPAAKDFKAKPDGTVEIYEGSTHYMTYRRIS